MLGDIIRNEDENFRIGEKRLIEDRYYTYIVHPFLQKNVYNYWWHFAIECKLSYTASGIFSRIGQKQSQKP